MEYVSQSIRLQVNESDDIAAVAAENISSKKDFFAVTNQSVGRIMGRDSGHAEFAEKYIRTGGSIEST